MLTEESWPPVCLEKTEDLISSFSSIKLFKPLDNCKNKMHFLKSYVNLHAKDCEDDFKCWLDLAQSVVFSSTWCLAKMSFLISICC